MELRFLEELRRAWPLLARGCLLRGGCSAQSLLAELRAAAGPRLRYVWQAQYTESPGGAAARVAAAGPRLPFAWQAQYTERPCGAAARVAVAGPRPFAWQAQYTEPPRNTAATQKA